VNDEEQGVLRKREEQGDEEDTKSPFD